jgi:lipoprotein-anchoring transpeptidase ErfK/SrfK
VTAPRPQRTALVATLALLSAATLAGCNEALGGDVRGEEQEPQVPEVEFATNVKARQDVPVDQVVKLRARNGRITEARLKVANGQGRVPGTIVRDGAAWRAKSLLEPGTTYRLVALAENEEGETTKFARTFSTDDLTLDEQTYPSIAPLDGQTVGVGMPVILRFDLPVKKKAAFEKRLSVETSPKQKGTWHWISDNEVRYRPRTFWKPGTEVTVKADINSVHAGDGIYGQEDRVASFRIGDAVKMKIDVANYNMKVIRNGELLRTIPISAGKDGFTTRSGTKVIIEKHRYKDMRSASIGIGDEADPEFYDLENVEYAMRVTYSGEFLHAAPWSVGSQGSANVSHGCVGMNTANAGWLYDVTKVGDVVEVTGTDRPTEPTNGYGDWNMPWHDYKKGSALS